MSRVPGAGAIGLLRFLSRPLDVATAREQVRRGVAGREERFLRSVKTLIYEVARSPYRRLLEWSGCEYADLVHMVRSGGIERALSELYEAGVYVSFAEFKGLAPIVRNGLVLQPVESDFDRPMAAWGIEASTSGTRSRGTRVMYKWDLIDEHAAVELLLYEIHGVTDSPAALWLPVPPGLAGISTALMRAKFRRPIDRWFTQVESYSVASREISSIRMRLGMKAIGAACAAFGSPLPRAELVNASNAVPVARWMADQLALGRRPLVRTYASAAVRIAAAASREDLDLSGSTILCGGEPVTETRRGFVEERGIRLVPRYSAAEAGLIGAACTKMEGADEMHVYMDRFALIGASGGDHREGIGSSRLLLSAISPHTPKVLLNTDIGDGGEVGSRGCDCLFGQIGMERRVRAVRSFDRATHEGMAVVLADLERLAARLVESAGGSPADYQFWEIEEEGGLTRLALVVNPSLNMDGNAEEALRRSMARELRGGALSAEIWRQSGGFRILRGRPRLTRAKKMLPLVRFAKGEAPLRIEAGAVEGVGTAGAQ